MTTTRLITLALLGVLAAATFGCGQGGKEEELARLQQENEALKAQLAGEAPSGATGPLEASAASGPLGASGDDWSWATGGSSPSGTTSAPPVHSVSEEPKPVPVEPAPEPARPKPPKPKPQPKPEEPKEPVNLLTQAPAPKPVQVTRTLTAGTPLSLTMSNGISSETAQVGDPVEAVLAADVMDAEGHVVLPAGTRVVGAVTEAVAAKKVDKKSRLAFHFNEAVLPDGSRMPVSAGRALEGKGWTKKDAGIIGGSAAGGALLGQVVGKDTGSTVAGAVLGGAIAAGARASKKGEDVGIDAGTALDLPLEVDASITREEMPPENPLR